MNGGEHGSTPRLDAIPARAALSEPQHAAIEYSGLSWTCSRIYGIGKIARRVVRDRVLAPGVH